MAQNAQQVLDLGLVGSNAVYWRNHDDVVINDSASIAVIEAAHPQSDTVELRLPDGNVKAVPPAQAIVTADEMYASAMRKAGIVQQCVAEMQAEFEKYQTSNPVFRALFMPKGDYLERHARLEYLYSSFDGTDIVPMRYAYEFHNEETGYTYWKTYMGDWEDIFPSTDVYEAETPMSLICPVSQPEAAARWLADKAAQFLGA